MGQQQSVQSKRHRSVKKQIDVHDSTDESNEKDETNQKIKNGQLINSNERGISVQTNSSNMQTCNTKSENKLCQHVSSIKGKQKQHHHNYHYHQQQGKQQIRAKQRRSSRHRRQSSKNTIKWSKPPYQPKLLDKKPSTSAINQLNRKNSTKSTGNVKVKQTVMFNSISQVKLSTSQRTVNVNPKQIMPLHNKMPRTANYLPTNPLCALQSNQIPNAQRQTALPIVATNTVTIHRNNDQNIKCHVMSATQSSVPSCRTRRGSDNVTTTTVDNQKLLHTLQPQRSVVNANSIYYKNNTAPAALHSTDMNVANCHFQNKFNCDVDTKTTNKNITNKVYCANNKNINKNSNNNNNGKNGNFNSGNLIFLQPCQSPPLTISPGSSLMAEQNVAESHLLAQPNPLNHANLHNVSQDRLSSSMRRKRVNSVVTVTDDNVVLADNKTALPPLVPLPLSLPLPPTMHSSQQIKAGCVNNVEKQLIGQPIQQGEYVLKINDNKCFDHTTPNTLVNGYYKKSLNAQQLPLTSVRTTTTTRATAADKQLTLSSMQPSMPTSIRPNHKNQRDQIRVFDEQHQQKSNITFPTKIDDSNNNDNILPSRRRLPALPPKQQQQQQQQKTIQPLFVQPKGILNRKSSYLNNRRHSFGAGRQFVQNDEDIAERLAKRDEVLSAYQTLPEEKAAMKMHKQLVQAQIQATSRIRANNQTSSNVQSNGDNNNSSFVSQQLYAQERQQHQQKQWQQQQQRQRQSLRTQQKTAQVQTHNLLQQPPHCIQSYVHKDYKTNTCSNNSGKERSESVFEKTNHLLRPKSNEMIQNSYSATQPIGQQTKQMSTDNVKMNTNSDVCHSNIISNSTICNVDHTNKCQSATHMPMLVLYEMPLRFRRTSFLASSDKTGDTNNAQSYPVKTYGQDCTQIKVNVKTDACEASNSVITYKVDELIAHRRASTAIDSVLLSNFKLYFVNGYSTCLFGLDSPSLVHATSALQAPSSLLIEKLILDVISEVTKMKCCSNHVLSPLQYQYQPQTLLQSYQGTNSELYCAIAVIMSSTTQHVDSRFVDLLAEYTCKDKDQRQQQQQQTEQSKIKLQSCVDSMYKQTGQKLPSSLHQIQTLPVLHFTSLQYIGIKFDNVTYHKIKDEQAFVSIFSQAQARANEFVSAYDHIFSNKSQSQTREQNSYYYYYVVSCVRVQGLKSAILEISQQINNFTINEVKRNDTYNKNQLMYELSQSPINAAQANINKQKYRTIASANILQKPNLSLHIPNNEVVLNTLTCVTLESRGQHYTLALTKAKQKLLHQYHQQILQTTFEDNKVLANTTMMTTNDLLSQLLTMPWYGMSVAGIDPRNNDACKALSIQHALAYNKQFTMYSHQNFVKQRCFQLFSEISALRKQMLSDGYNNRTSIQHLISKKQAQLHAIKNLLHTVQ